MREHIRRVSRLAAIFLVNVALLVPLLVTVEGLSSYAFFLRDVASRAGGSNLGHTDYDAEIGWVGLQNVDIKDMYGPGAHLRTNAQGFRNAQDFPAKRHSDARRIVCSGDSVTFGEYVGNDQTFCSLLAEREPRLETINMGQVGYGVDQAYLLYKRDADDLEVDVHILAFITHDFLRMQYDEFMGIPRPVVALKGGKPVVTNAPISQSRCSTPTWLAETLNRADGLRTFRLATAIRGRLNLGSRELPGAWAARGAEEVEAVVAGMLEDLRDYDSARSRATVLVYFPSGEELQQPSAELAYWMSAVESNAGRLDTPFINFVSLFGELPAADVARLYVDGYHFSEEGHVLVARKILEHLRDDPRTSGRLAAPRRGSDSQPTLDPRVCPCSGGDICVHGTCSSPKEHWWNLVEKPDASNTGPSRPGILSPANSPPKTIRQDGATYENFISRGIRIEADNVTLRNFKIDASRDYWGIWIPDGHSGILIEDGEIDGHRAKCNDGVRGPGWTGRRLNIHGCGDGMKAHGIGGPVLVEHSYIWDVKGSHGDGVQSFEAHNVTFRYNTIIGGNTSAFIVHSNEGTTNYRIINNWIDGTGHHYVLRCGRNGDELQVKNNLFGRNFTASAGYGGP
ncbi:MAG: hypothetical protein HKN10_08735, partial [Myxococcales bacterium]|nr:hypothetical protein [Myxococcales bacterium]